MAENNVVEIVIKAREEVARAMSKVMDSLRQAKDQAKETAAATQEISRGIDRAASSAGRLGSELGRVVGVTLSVAGAAALVHKGFDSWRSLITSGLKAVDDYETAIISASAALTNLVDPDKFKGTYEEAYGLAKQYFQDLWKWSAEADKKAAASAREIFQVGAEMAKYHMVPVSQKDVDVVARLTDAIKAFAPAGEGGARVLGQIKQEIRALAEGRAVPGAQLAMQLKTQDALFEEHLRKARELGTVYEYLDSQLKGFAASQKDMSNTLGSVMSSLEALWQVIQIEAFRNAYREVVGLIQEIVGLLMQSGQLTATGKRLAEALAKAWDEVKSTIRAAFSQMLADPSAVIKNITSIASAIGTITSAAIRAAEVLSRLINLAAQAASNPLITGAGGAAIGWKVGGPYGALAGGVAGFGYGAYNMAGQIEEARRKAAQAAAQAAPPGDRLAPVPLAPHKRIEVTADQVAAIEREAAARAGASTAAYDRLFKGLRSVGAGDAGGSGGGKAPRVLAFEDVNRVLDQLQDKAAQAAEAVRDLAGEYEKLSQPARAPLIDISKWFDQQQKRATGFTRDAERIVREFGERIQKAEAEGVTVNPEVYTAYETAKNLLAKVKADEVRIIEQASQEKLLKEREYQDKYQAEVLGKMAGILDQALNMERLNYAERRKVAQAYLAVKTAVIDQEIAELRKKYPGQIPEDVLGIYRQAQLEQVNKQIKSATSGLALEWEAAWKRAAENVQDALANTIYTLVTQTKSAGDMLRNILNGMLQIMSQMAAKALMELAKVAIESAGIFGSRGGGGFLGGLIGAIGGLFGFGGAAANTSSFGYISGGFTPSAMLPGFAEGGISYSPTLAWVSERGPEAHIPLQGGAVPVRLQRSQPEQIQIINVFDQTAVQALAVQAMNSDTGRRIILNTVNSEMLSRGTTMRVIRGR